jgi:hypothetical protein
MLDFPGLTFAPLNGTDPTRTRNGDAGTGPTGSATPIQDAIQTLRFNVPRFGGARTPVDPSLLYGVNQMPGVLHFFRRLFGQVPQGQPFSLPQRPLSGAVGQLRARRTRISSTPTIPRHRLHRCRAHRCCRPPHRRHRRRGTTAATRSGWETDRSRGASDVGGGSRSDDAGRG